MGERCPHHGPIMGASCRECGWRPPKAKDADQYAPKLCQRCPNGGEARVFVGHADYSHVCLQCYEDIRIQTRLDAIRDALLDEHPEWWRGRDETRETYFLRMQAMRKKIGATSGVRRMP